MLLYCYYYHFAVTSILIAFIFDNHKKIENMMLFSFVMAKENGRKAPALTPVTQAGSLYLVRLFQSSPLEDVVHYADEPACHPEPFAFARLSACFAFCCN